MSDGLRLLRSILASGSLSAFRDIDSELFVQGPETEAYEVIRRHLREYGVIPQIGTVEEAIEHQLPSAPEPVDFYLGACVDRHLYAEIRPQFQSLQTSLREFDMSQAREVCFGLARTCRINQTTEDLLDFTTLAERVNRSHQLNRLRTDSIPGIPTGWPTIDEKTLGWNNSDLIVIVARPEMGKTHILLNSCRHAWEAGHSVLFASMEMGPEQIGYRLIAQMAGVNPWYYRRGELSYFGERRVREAVERMSNTNRFHLFSGEFKGKTTDSLDYAIQEHSPDAVYLDGLYLMKPSDAPRNVGRYEKVAYIVDELKGLCLRRDRPVIATTQFGRNSGAKGLSGDLESIGYTDTLGTHSTIVLAIKNPPASLNPSGLPVRYPNKRILEFLKGREGEQGSVLIDFKFGPIGFNEVYETEDQREERLLAQEREVNPSRGGGGGGGRAVPQNNNGAAAFVRGRSTENE